MTFLLKSWSLNLMQEMGMGGQMFDRQQAQKFAQNAKDEGKFF